MPRQRQIPERRVLSLPMAMVTAALVISGVGCAGGQDASRPETTAAGTEQTTETATTADRSRFPEGFPEEFPVHPSLFYMSGRLAEVDGLADKVYVLNWSSSDPTKPLESWYVDEMTARGWVAAEPDDVDIRFQRGDELASFVFGPQGDFYVVQLRFTTQ